MRSAVILFVAAAVLAAAALAGQDADTVLLHSDSKRFTLLSQISDGVEANAFLQLYRASDPKLRFAMANRFIEKYPRSWLLAQAYDAAARSAIDLERLEDAMRDARFSLRIMPENPSLLVLVANMESRNAQFSRAVTDASDAIDYLGQFDEAPALTSRLMASAYFARGRAHAQQALAEKLPDPDELTFALRDLDRAAAWNSSDPEIFYLRGMVELELKETAQAASDLTFVSSCEGPLKTRADKLLGALPKNLTVKPRKIDASLREQNRRPDFSKALSAGYAGPKACQSCHSQEYDTWSKTGMARMLQPYSAQNIIGDFSTTSEFRESEFDAVRMGIAGRPYFEVWTQNQWQRFYVDFTIGSKWQQAYATRLPDGRLQVLPVEYNLLAKKWVNYWELIDPPGSARAVLHDFPKLSAATNYQQNCAICHTSQLKSDQSTADPMQHAQFLQPGIDCEMCHGPGALHARRAAKGDLDHPHAGEPPFDFRKADHREAVRVCAQCHEQSAVREIGAGGEMNYSTTGSYVPETTLRSFDAFSRKAFYKDGRFRETTFIVEAFTRSACYRLGTAQCASCHSPHTPDFQHNPTSLKFAANPNEMCLGCHVDLRSRVAQHSRHKAGTEASQCVTCHMPRIVNALLFKARSHQIEIPAADLTERFGQDESPNVCLTCHAEKDARWASAQLAGWSR